MNLIFISSIIGIVAFLLGIIGTILAMRIGWLPVRGEKTLGGKEKRDLDRLRRIEKEKILSIFSKLGIMMDTLNYTRVLDSSLDMINQMLIEPSAKEDGLVSLVLLFSIGGEESKLHIKASRRLTRADEGLTFPAREGLLRRTIDDGEPIHIRNINQDPELSRAFALRSCTSAYCYPLRSGIDVYGVMLFAHPAPSFFNADKRRVLKFVCNQAMIAIQNARLYNDLKSEKERIVEIEGETRKKLARDLHDGPTQSVAAISMRINFARRLLDKDPQQAASELYKIENLARRTTKEIRQMLFTLRPLVLESKGLIPAVEAMAEKMAETYKQNVFVDIDKRIIPKMDIGEQGVVFNIIEEAVQNARKHAKAEHIWVRFMPIAVDLAMLEIEDDGVGFDVNAVNDAYESRGSLGMINLRERADLVNGVLHISSEESKGTKIQLVIPLTEEASNRIHHQ